MLFAELPVIKVDFLLIEFRQEKPVIFVLKLEERNRLPNFKVNFLQLKNLFCFLLFCCTCLCFFGCEEKDSRPVPAGEGGVRVTVSPAEATGEMRLNLHGAPVKIIYSDSGVFQANDLKPDNYFVTFIPAPGFSADYYLRANIESGKVADLGHVVFNYSVTGKKGSMSATINGTAWESVTRSAVFHNSDLYIEGFSFSTTSSIQGTINLNLKNVTGSGTFTTPSWAGFKREGINSGKYWDTIDRGYCQINITELDTIKRKVSGNFTFKAYPMSQTDTTTIRAVNGIFTDVEIK